MVSSGGALPPSAPPFRPPSPPSSYEFDITLLFGVLLALVAASGIGMAMVIQRHGLIHGNCRTWFMGLVLYGISNGLQAASLTVGPLFLLGGVFTLLLVFNLVFARIILREEATIFKLSGAVVMIGGVAMSVNAAPDAQTEFSGQEIDARASSFKGAFWLIFLTLMLFASIAAMVMFERQYPAALSVSPAEAGHHSPRTPRLPVVDSHSPSPYLPSRRLNNCMAVVYPVSLGLDEGWAQLSLRTWLVMVTNSSENNATVDHWAFYTFSFIWVISSLATVPYMRVVFRRYETTMALPIEYGTVFMANIGSGLLFFDETKKMADWQLANVLVSTVIVLGGMVIGQLDRCRAKREPARPTRTCNAPRNDLTC
ncbi:hypothetical protein AB1Y20_003662 [Prymnesium parvum]|uniref:Magnesium transporter n=1 Tax=Prymnesium parvum TaxID=97485 RepID=A0AB34J4I7_PRYPA